MWPEHLLSFLIGTSVCFLECLLRILLNAILQTKRLTIMFHTHNRLDSYQASQTPQFNPTSLMNCLYEAVRQYQLQSPDHYELGIEVQQVGRPYGRSVGTALNNGSIEKFLNVLFYGNSTEGSITLPVQCHLQSSGRRSGKKSWTCLSVSCGATVDDLDTFLSSTFPIIDGPLRHDTLALWWHANGKSFNWTALPTELKERVIVHCLHHPTTYGIFSERLAHFDRRPKPPHEIRRPGPFEIIEQLGDWFHLLSVSHQIRAIALRLCIAGGGALIRSKGLCLPAASYKDLRERVCRLADHYQMTNANGVPISPAEHALSKTYDRFPKIYSYLSRFSSFAHGIQKISLGMDWLSYMHFFQVKAGGFERYYDSFTMVHKKVITYEVFDRLPCLNEIVVRLPLRPYGGWRDKPGQCGPQIWHVDSPCPRAVHRTIYERVAEVLAPYNVMVWNLIDYAEMRRYQNLRAEAVKALKFAEGELKGLYAEDGGGIKLLEGQNERSVELQKLRRTQRADAANEVDVQNDFWPPPCFCDEPCILARVLTARKHAWHTASSS